MKTDSATQDWHGSHRSRSRLLPWAVVVAAHPLLIATWRLALRTEVDVTVSSGSAQARVMWLQALRDTPSPPVTPATPQPSAHPPTVPAPRAPARAVTAPAAPAQAPGVTDQPAPSDAPTLSLLPEPPASAPPERLMDSAATRQAIRDASRGPLLSERAATATGLQPVTQAQRLSTATEGALKGDCGKGEYAGGGMGLLSLPFWAAAAATGQCAR